MQQVVAWVRVAVLVASMGIFWAVLVPRFLPWAALLCASLVLPVVLWPSARSRSIRHRVGPVPKGAER